MGGKVYKGRGGCARTREHTSMRLNVLHATWAKPLRRTPRPCCHPMLSPPLPGADVNFVFGKAYKCPEGYTPLMVACHRGRCARSRGHCECARSISLHACVRPRTTHPAGRCACNIHLSPGLSKPRRLECAKALLRAGADPNYVNGAGDLTLFWGIDGGAAMIQLLLRFGADVDAASPKVRRGPWAD